MSVARLGLVLGPVTGAVAGFVIAGWVAAVVLTVIAAIGAMYAGLALGAVRREVYGARVEAMARDRAAYRAWSASIAKPEPPVCDCPFSHGIHDAGCPALLID